MFNYGEYIFQQLVTSDFIQKKLSHILVAIVANIIQLHIVTILCIILSINPYLDFFIQIWISVFMALHAEYIYNAILRYEQEFLSFTRYLIDNYSLEKYRFWKRIIVFSACGYACVALLFIELTNSLVLLYIGQYMICFLIIEQFEQKRVHQWIKALREKPTVTKTDYMPEEINLIESYMSPSKKILQKRREVKVKPRYHEFYLVPENGNNKNMNKRHPVS